MGEFKNGMGFRIPHKDGMDAYGVVMGVVRDETGGESIKYYPVRPVYNSVIGSSEVMYDDPRASYMKHKDNVPLLDCPPPFSDMFMNGKSSTPQIYAKADAEHPQYMPVYLFNHWQGEIVDNGAKLSEHDMALIEKHPFPQHKEKEFTHVRNSGNTNRELLLDFSFGGGGSSGPDFP